MNTKYDLGNVLRSTQNFANYKQPAELPTEEWAGNEVRAYVNYARPIANLFENDRESVGFIKDVCHSINDRVDEYAIISGCGITKTPVIKESSGVSTTYTYFEIQHGAFVSAGRIYYIFPECEGAAKQLESVFESDGLGELKIKFTYDYDTNTYLCNGTVNNITMTEKSSNVSAAQFLDLVITEINRNLAPGLSISMDIEDSILLPIFKDLTSTKIYFQNGAFATGTSPASNYVEFCNIDNEGRILDDGGVKYTTIDGDRIEADSIKNSSLNNNTITIGSTTMALGDTQTVFNGVDKLNNVQIFVNSIEDTNEGLHINNAGRPDISDGAYGITTKDNYTLGDACEKYFSADTTMSALDNEKLPTVEAVRTFVNNQIDNKHRAGTITFNNGITVIGGAAYRNGDIALASNAKLYIENANDASRSGGALSSSASIYTKGGIEAEKGIYSNGSIIGTNSGTYSLRKLKENITPFRKSATKLINDVKIVNYNYIADPEKNKKVGFIADDTDELLSTKNHNIMDQSNCIGILLKAVQELSAEIKTLKGEINELRTASRNE